MALDRLSRIAILAAVVASASTIIAAIVILPQLQDPFRNVGFTTERDSYMIGQNVVFILVNNGDRVFGLEGWTVHRFLDDQWVGVECEVVTAGTRGLHPGGELSWSWLAETADPKRCITDPPVEPGLYRGVAWFRGVEQPRRFLFTEFFLT